MNNGKAATCPNRKKRSLKTGRLSDFASYHVNAVYSAAESEERARSSLKAGILTYRYHIKIKQTCRYQMNRCRAYHQRLYPRRKIHPEDS